MSYLNESKNTLFKPSKIRNQNGKAYVKNLTLANSSLDNDIQNSISILNKNSFIYSDAGSPFKNTQQLSVDFSKFEKHAFFNSAYNKTLIAINKVVNSFPFDGKKDDIDKFIESLTGFEKYIYNLFPKYVGYLNFDGSNYIEVKDFKGSGNYITNENLIGENLILDFGFGSFTIEMNLRLDEEPTNNNQIIFQRLKNGLGYSFGILQNQSSDFGTLFFLRNDGNVTSKTECQVKKDSNLFFHVAIFYDYFDDQKIKFYVDGELVQSSNQVEFNSVDFSETNFLIGKGLDHGDVSNVGNFIGSINNFRFFKSAKNQKLIKKYKNLEMFYQKDLVLHYKFNEPYNPIFNNISDIQNSDLVLDYSGNRMHSLIKNYNNNQRLTLANYDNLKDSSRSPILFMDHPIFKQAFENLLSEAIDYDANNPNLITKLIPPHYITEENNYFYGKDPLNEDFLEDIDPIINLPGGAKKPKNSIITSILFTWAHVFDEIKMFIDEMGKIGKIDYTNEKSMCDHLLPYLSKQFDLELPTPFSNTTLEQYIEGRNLNIDESLGQLSLQQVQNTMWRRILSDAVEIRRTKGTKNSIKSVLRNTGINPYGPFRLKEYGGSLTKKISDSYEIKQESSRMLDFSAGAISLVTPYLSSSRVEPGVPEISGFFSAPKEPSNNENDGLFTSGSWAVEARVKLDRPNLSMQSLMRLQTVGTNEDDEITDQILFNLVAHPPDKYIPSIGKIELWGSPNTNWNDSSKVPIYIELENLNIFDGNDWYVSFGRQRSDGNLLLTSSYFLRAGRFKSSGMIDFYEKTFYYNDNIQNFNPLNEISSNYNASGSYVSIGIQELNEENKNLSLFKNNFPSSNYLKFEGKLSNFRFYSKFLNKDEAKAHVLSFKNAGVSDPKVNYNFNSSDEGSYEKLRIDLSFMQKNYFSDDQKKLQIFDYSQNEFHSQVICNSEFINPFSVETFFHQILNPKFESGAAENKVRVRSFTENYNLENYNGFIAPLYEIPANEQPNDDRRVEIEASIVQALNEDIMTIFSSLDSFNNYIGSPEHYFSREYRDLRNLRKIYFNRLTDKIKISTFFQFFKWFDETIGDILEELIPYNSQFMGTNFVIESHALERPKFTYSHYDMYMGSLDRRTLSVINLQFFTGNIRKR